MVLFYAHKILFWNFRYNVYNDWRSTALFRFTVIEYKACLISSKARHTSTLKLNHLDKSTRNVVTLIRYKILFTMFTELRCYLWYIHCTLHNSDTIIRRILWLKCVVLSQDYVKMDGLSHMYQMIFRFITTTQTHRPLV